MFRARGWEPMKEPGSPARRMSGSANLRFLFAAQDGELGEDCQGHVRGPKGGDPGAKGSRG